MSSQVVEAKQQNLTVEEKRGISAEYKQTEVGIIPEDWDVVTIDNALKNKLLLDQMDGNHGELYPKSHEFSSFGVPYIGATDFYTGHIDYSSCKYLPIERANKFKKGIAINGDVLFAHNATVGPVAIVNIDIDYIIISTTATYYRTNKAKINNVYLANYFKSEAFITQFTKVMSQSTRNQVPILVQREFKLILPPIKEQNLIANALSDVDVLISELEKLIAKKQAIKTATMQQLLTGRTRLPQFALREDGTKKGYKQSELGDVPEDWEVGSFGSILTIRHGKNQKSVENFNGNIPILATGGQIGWADQYIYNKPSILIGRKGTIDKPRFMDKPFWTVDTLFYSEISEKISPKYLFYKFIMIDWMQYNEASGVPSLNVSTIERVQVSLPLFKEQTAIATILSEMESEIQALEKRLSKTRQIKQGMMQELLTGKTRLVKPSKEIIHE